MDDYFFSLDSLLADAYVDALDHGSDRYAHMLYIQRGLIAEEENQ